MPSEDFEAFYFSCFDRSYGAVHNGLDVPALLRLKDQERVEAEQLIVKAIETVIDCDRPIRAAGHLKLKSAIQPLRQRLGSPIDTGREYNRVQAAWALYQIEQYPEAAQLIISILQAIPRNSMLSRWWAVEARADFEPNSLIVNTLFDTMRDEDALVACNATTSLEHMFESDRQVVDSLNDVLLLQTGHKGAGISTDIVETRDRARIIVMRLLAR
jgi:hypothetical protein